jgi:hypothetical protein
MASVALMVRSGRVDQHLRASEQRVEVDDVLGDALLAVIETGEPAAGAGSDERRERPGRIAARRLDLDHLGAEIGEQARGVGAGRQGAELDHAQMRQRTHC